MRQISNLKFLIYLDLGAWFLALILASKLWVGQYW
jgi:hypothetical protein